MTKQKSINLFVILILSLSLVIFTFFDLAVSDYLYNQNSNFAKIFEVLGGLPGWLIAPLFMLCLFWRFKDIRIKIAAAVLLPAVSFFWINSILSAFYLSNTAFYLILLALIAISSFTLIILFKNIDEKTLKILFIILLSAGIFVLADTIIVQIIKLFWGRVRYYDLNDNFTHWFLPRGITNDTSFPSGHTSSACALFNVILLCKYFKIPKIVKIILLIASMAFIVLAAVSRIVIGAHYATDVIFSILLAYILFLISARLVGKYINK